MIKWMKNGTLALVMATLGLVVPTGCGNGDTAESVVPNVEALVFLRRPFLRANGEHNVAGGNGQTIDYRRYQPGEEGVDEGGVYVLRPPTPDGELTNLTEQFEGVDVNGLDVSFDATRVLFSMRTSDTRHYQIYEATLDGADIRQLTFGDWDSSQPQYVAGDRVAFITNRPYTEMGRRADEYNHSRGVGQIAMMDLNLGEASVLLCPQNLSNTVRPFTLSDGTIGYTRWEHFNNRNDAKLFRMNPDCTNMVALAGEFNKPGNSLFQASEIIGQPGRFVTSISSRMDTIQAGAPYLIDARSTTSTDPELFLDVQQATFTPLAAGVPTGEASPPSNVGRYRDMRNLGYLTDNFNQYITSWANGDVNARNELAGTAPNFGIYLYDADTGDRTLIYDSPNTWDVYALPVAPRDEPPVIGSLQDRPDPNEPSILGSIDVTQTSLNNSINGAQFDGTPLNVALGEAEAVRILEGFSSEIGPIGMFGLTMNEGAAMLGESPVQADGSWRAAVPGYLPYHLQPIDRFGMSIRNQLLWIQAMPGETRTCGGCHASRSETVEPRSGTQTIAQQVGADQSTFLQDISARMELPWYGSTTTRNVQDMLNENCVSCHDGGANDPYAGRFYTVNVTTMEGEELEFQIPYLELSDRLIEVYYDDELVTYPASYVSLLYPSAMMGDSTATGDVPAEWITPGAARTSRAIEVMNIASRHDANELAWADRPLHPEDQGAPAVSREDRMMFIRSTDFGSQYYSRQNVPNDAGGYGVFTPNSSDY